MRMNFLRTPALPTQLVSALLLLVQQAVVLSCVSPHLIESLPPRSKNYQRYMRRCARSNPPLLRGRPGFFCFFLFLLL